ncbi:hypothetical protein ACJQWK_02599 [Exserohilum turcicum]|uniref:Uncharacterized protein n=1 Tax=Exserohilum turcicum (strain 28A) TaxID=671987 RepID=R0KKN8_EXST2|nr:uncharacterized protein SETTUDRAFT_26013 [Exserohilum turcica Et28A]EOA89684.1 hypothetical protein SETTUDRAFT_26013 [Exserohilum turcica Et28A]
MAVRLDSSGARVPRNIEIGEVSICVAGIVEAFSNGLSIFKRLRERRRKRRSSRKESDTPDAVSAAEHQLSKSLRKGPSEVAEKYAECYHSGVGPWFAKGDAIAHASLAETLIKLNTGLVAIIASFLNHDHKTGKSNLDLDYKSLTHLSDASRREALHSLTQLYQRLCQAHIQLQLHKLAASACPRCGATKHHDCSSRSASPDKEKKKRSSSSSRQRSAGQVVTRMPIRHGSSNHPQLVVMRPRLTRKTTSSTNNSTGVKSSNSSRTTSPLTSPQPKKAQLASPEPKKLQPAPQLPLYVPVDPLELETSGVIRGTLGGGPIKTGTVKQRVDSFQDPREPWPQEHLHHTITKSPSPKPKTVSRHAQEPTPKLPTFSPTPRRAPTPIPTPAPSPSSKPAVPSKPEYLSPPPLLDHAPATIHFRRRMEKATPSSYTFASDSTKMGEIPQRKWTSPFDFEKAERLNAEAALNGYPNASIAADKTEKRKKRFGFMRRGDM